MAVVRWCVMLGCAVLAVVVLTAGLPSAPAPRPPRWQVSTAIHAADAGLTDVIATGRDDAWATGSSAASTPVVYRWDGNRWQPMDRPGSSGSAAASVAASSAANVWVAIADEAAVDHWNGHAWSRVSFGPPGRIEIDGIATSGRRDVWAFAYNRVRKRETAFHYDGTAWRGTPLAVTLGGGGTARLVSSSSRSNIWAWAYDVARGGWVSLHFNGSRWRVIPLPARLLPAGHTILPEQMLAVSATSVWGTIYAATGSSRGPVVLMHWNGLRWSRVTGRLPAGALAGPIAGDGNGGLWLYAVRPAGAGYLVHYLHGTWTSAAGPASSGSTVSVTALTHVPGTSSLWASGTIGVGFGTSHGAAILSYGR
ncbi:MAG: hypothetical protein ABSB01_12740 [Streptosporangiaceae bacterium]